MRAHWPLFMGAELVRGGGVRFRVWAPVAETVEVELQGARGLVHYPLLPEGNGVFAGVAPEAGSGSLYKFRLDGGPSYPDPYSRKQPVGVHGPSEVVDPEAYDWRDERWPGMRGEGLVIYECHVGTYTPEGTFEALAGELAELQRLGVTALELMPVAEVPGRRNWGYDGVDLFAPTMNYGGPEGLKRLVEAAHQVGLAVLLDVVYNHFGPDGNYLRAFAPQYFTDRHQTPWGEALNFDGEGRGWVRHLIVENACYWLNEFRLDGLRLDATHAIRDESSRHILQEIAEQARASVSARQVVVIAEDGNNDVSLIRPVAEGGRGLDGVWADDFHHSMRTFLTGERDGYFEDYAGDLDSVAKALREGFVYQGQRSPYLGRPRGTKVTDEPAHRFVFCIQNHDQVGNRAFGERLHHVVNKAQHLTAAAVLLLAPETPLLFMGQEFAASAPFRYFTDHEPELGRLVTEGRREEFKRFSAFRDPALRERIPDPQAEETFLASKLDLSERVTQAGVYQCYIDLLGLRSGDVVFSRPDRDKLRAKAIGDKLLAVHRWQDGQHRLVMANFGAEVALELGGWRSLLEIPDLEWDVLWSTLKVEYWEQAAGEVRVEARGERGMVVHVPAGSAVVLAGGFGE